MLGELRIMSSSRANLLEQLSFTFIQSLVKVEIRTSLSFGTLCQRHLDARGVRARKLSV